MIGWELLRKIKKHLRIVMRACLFFIVCVILLGACRDTQLVENGDVVAKVGERVLSRSEIRALIPLGLTSADSLLFAESYVKKWVKNALIYDVAMRNLARGERDEVDKLVEAYKHSLVKQRFQEKLVTERLVANIRESDKLNFYEENQSRFVLDKGLVKGLFLKIPVDAPGLSDVKRLYKSNSAESLERIEKYSIQNASIYEYFYDKWVDFDEVINNIPILVRDADAFLKTNTSVEVSDSSYCYLLNLQEYMLKGSIAPYDYVESQIVEMLMAQQKKDFLENFENELYIDAVNKGEVIFSEP